MLRPFEYLSTLRRRRQIRRDCADALAQYRRIRAELPQVPARDAYAQIIANLCDTPDMRAAHDGVRRAEESFAMWPVERPPCLRDIAQYIAMTERLTIDVAVSGVSSHAVELVLAIAAETIPKVSDNARAATRAMSAIPDIGACPRRRSQTPERTTGA